LQSKFREAEIRGKHKGRVMHLEYSGCRAIGTAGRAAREKFFEKMDKVDEEPREDESSEMRKS